MGICLQCFGKQVVAAFRRTRRHPEGVIVSVACSCTGQGIKHKARKEDKTWALTKKKEEKETPEIYAPTYNELVDICRQLSEDNAALRRHINEQVEIG